MFWEIFFWVILFGIVLGTLAKALHSIARKMER